MSARTLLLVGATGAVGSEVLGQALADRRVGRIVAPTRRPLATAHAGAHAKLLNPVVDFAALTGAEPWWPCDAVICTLGTTIRIAGSQAAFAQVDRDLPIRFGRLALAAGATAYALNSSLGASAKGNFYLRTKAEAEAGILALGFASVTLVRPSLIDAERSESRPGERAGILVARALRPLIPARYRAVTSAAIARALLDGALAAPPGTTIVESKDLA